MGDSMQKYNCSLSAHRSAVLYQRLHLVLLLFSCQFWSVGHGDVFYVCYYAPLFKAHLRGHKGEEVGTLPRQP